ncbi:sigma-70 RNA polymerase sigma factor region 4 domain-containing protein [Streptomyces wuyuanensis]|uniref:hypothetical protein n=1 Tax=Streptomyces wuyuanensis TaxID=1196353 RepID=UPI00368A4BC8
MRVMVNCGLKRDLDSLLAGMRCQQDVREGWELLKDPLARYGHSVLRAWISNGTIFSRIDRLTKIRLRGATELFDDPDAATELSGLTVAVAARSFMLRMEQGNGWHPEGGSSIKTYFIGQCLMCFPNEYRRWLREHRAGSMPTPVSPHQEYLDIADDAPGPEHLAALHVESLQILGQAPARTRTALAFTAAGYSQREIAGYLGTTPKGVEKLLHRYRKRYL